MTHASNVFGYRLEVCCFQPLITLNQEAERIPCGSQNCTLKFKMGIRKRNQPITQEHDYARLPQLSPETDLQDSGIDTWLDEVLMV